MELASIPRAAKQLLCKLLTAEFNRVDDPALFVPGTNKPLPRVMEQVEDTFLLVEDGASGRARAGTDFT